jgi:hypothetical protein
LWFHFNYIAPSKQKVEFYATFSIMPRDLITLFGLSLLFGIFYLIIFDSRAQRLSLIGIAVWLSPIIHEFVDKLVKKRLRRRKKVK